MDFRAAGSISESNFEWFGPPKVWVRVETAEGHTRRDNGDNTEYHYVPIYNEHF